MSKVTMYLALDTDSVVRLFAVVGDKMAVSTYSGCEDTWLSPSYFKDRINLWCYEDVYFDRIGQCIQLWEEEV